MKIDNSDAVSLIRVKNCLHTTHGSVEVGQGVQSASSAMTCSCPANQAAWLMKLEQSSPVGNFSFRVSRFDNLSDRGVADLFNTNESHEVASS